jgi:hypothetical protein
MMEKRDQETEKEIEKWIEAVVGVKLSPPGTALRLHSYLIPFIAAGDLSESLKSGVVLCKLINAIQPGALSLSLLVPHYIPTGASAHLFFFQV